MRTAAGLALLLLAGCASAPAAAPVPRPAAEPASGFPANLAGVPSTVIASRALFDLDSGDPERMERARCVLVALSGEGVPELLRARLDGSVPGSPERLRILSLLEERGDPVEGVPPAERTAMNLQAIAGDGSRARATILALARLRAMGEEARAPLEEAARAGGPAGDLAARVFCVLFGEEVARGLRGPRP